MKSRSGFFIGILLGLSLSIGMFVGYFGRDYLKLTAESWPVLHQAYEVINDHGLKDLPPPPSVEYGMIHGLLQVYDDPFTSFVEPVQHELETNTLQGSFGGIGVRLGRDQNNQVVLFPFPDSPAEQAGVLEGDRLIRVDNLEVNPSISTEDVQAALRGPVGTKVTVSVSRAPDYIPLKFTVKRAEIPLPSVTWHIDPDESRLGVLEINVIASSTPDEVDKAVEDLMERGATALALDLRDNYGGLLNAGIDTARLFLEDGVVIQQQYRGESVESFEVERPGLYTDIPMVVLVNQHTASAAEIIAGSLKVQERATLIGSPTFGKDSIQLVFDLQDGSSIHVTAARWWIPGLEPPIGGNGIQPDLSIPIDEDSNTSDQALLTTIEFLFAGN
jgi:carboxyl-terminal processing protease